MVDPLFESERLVFRPMTKADLPKLIKLNADEEVMRFFPKTMTSEETEIFFDKVQQHQVEHGYSLYGVSLKETNEFIGIIGLLNVNFEHDIQGEVEIGWRLLKEYWGMGYASEGAKAVLDYGFHTLGLNQIYAFTAAINTPSENVMKRLGMKLLNPFDHPKVADDSSLKPHVLYCMTKEDFLK